MALITNTNVTIVSEYLDINKVGLFVLTENDGVHLKGTYERDSFGFIAMLNNTSSSGTTGATLPTTVSTYAEITTQGIYWLDTVDGDNAIGLYVRVEDGTINYYTVLSKTIIKSISVSQNIQDVYNNGILTVLSNLSLTVLENLPLNFNCIIDTLGGDLTLVAGANVIFKDKDNIAIATPTMADGGRLSIYRIEGTNEFLLKGDL